jgi:hypothetical protein
VKDRLARQGIEIREVAVDAVAGAIRMAELQAPRP